MKVAFVANTCWNIYNFRKGLVHHFLQRGDEVIVLAPRDEYTEKIRKWGVKWVDTPLEGTGTNPIKDLGYLKTIRKIFKQEKPDVALAFTIKANIYSSLAGRSAKIPVICNVSGLGTVFLVEGMVGKVAMKLYKVAFKSSRLIFFQNEDDKNLFISHVQLPEERIGMLPGSGINLDEYKVAQFHQRDRIHFLMISRVIIEKGVREFAAAAAAFSKDENVKFTLVGKFDEDHARSISRQELNQWISDGNLAYLSHSDEVEELISDADAVILPSYREGTPRTLLEGAALGRPLLATQVPGCKEVVRDGFNGFLFEVKNAGSLIDKIKLFLALSSDERKQLGINSRKLVEEVFDEKIVIDIYDQAIRRIIESA